MKKLSIPAFLIVALCISSTSFARDGALYIGIGGSYAIDDFETEEFEERRQPIDVDIDGTWGANLKLGYHVNEFFAVEALFDYVPGFETAESTTTADAATMNIISKDGELDVMTFMVAGKFSWPGRAIEPYGVIGVGVMHADWDRKLSTGGGSASDSVSVSSAKTGGCSKVGVGVDFFLTDHFSLGAEGATVFTLGNLEFDLDPSGEEVEELGIRYWGITLGAAYHF